MQQISSVVTDEVYMKKFICPTLTKNICKVRTNVLNIYLDRSINFGTTITSAILTTVIPMLHPKIFQSKAEFSKWILATTVQMKKQNKETRQMTEM